jgi:hypothetical protein
MKSLDDILFGFFIFFAIDRAIRLFTNAIVEPWAEKTVGTKRESDNIKLGTEFALLVGACFAVYYGRGILLRLNKT